MKVAIIGLGLIGGSLAKTIKKHTDDFVIGFNRSPAVCEFALECGAIDKIGKTSDLSEADLTIVCIYPDATINYISEHIADFKKGSVVIDACGIKEKVCNAFYDKDLPFTFIGAHPMAGREVSGFENSLDNLYDGASFIFTPKDAESKEVAFLKEYALKLGFGRTAVTTPKEHDEIIAFTSQIAHVLACAYVLSPNSNKHFGFSAGSFKDVSRVAKINEKLWTELFIENKDALCAEIECLTENLDKFKEAIDTMDYGKLESMLHKSRTIKEKLDNEHSES